MAVDLDDGGVDQGVFHIRLVRAGLKKPDEDIGFDPIPVSLEHGVPAPERRRKIPPWAARAHDPQHRFQKKPVIAPAAPRVRRLAAAVGLHLRPLGVSQNELIHPELESRASSGGNPESQHALANIGARSFNSLGKRMPRFPWGSGGGGVRHKALYVIDLFGRYGVVPYLFPSVSISLPPLSNLGADTRTSTPIAASGATFPAHRCCSSRLENSLPRELVPIV